MKRDLLTDIWCILVVLLLFKLKHNYVGGEVITARNMVMNYQKQSQCTQEQIMAHRASSMKSHANMTHAQREQRKK